MRVTSPTESPAAGADELPKPASLSIYDAQPITWSDRVFALGSFVTLVSGLAWTCAVFYRSRPDLPDGGGMVAALASVHWEWPSIGALVVTVLCSPRSFWD